MPPTHPYTIHTLPRSHPNLSTWHALVTAFKLFRLHALQTSPTAFSSSHVREAAFTHEQWEERLRNPLAYTLVAVPSTDSQLSDTSNQPRSELSEALDPDEAWMASEWAGSAVLVGPTPTAENSNTASPPPWIFDLFALFVRPAARGRGIARRLVDAAVSKAEEVMRSRGGGGDVVVRVRVARGNGEVVALYRKCGFDVEQSAQEGEGNGEGEVVMVRRGGV